MNELIEEAIKYADDPLHRGADYTLKIMTPGGIMDVKVFSFNGKPVLSTFTDKPIFLRSSDVIWVRVDW